VRTEGVAQGVTARALRDAGAADGVAARPLSTRFGKVMAALLARRRMPPAAALREDPLPAPLARRPRVLSLQRIGQLDATPAGAQVALVDRLDARQV